MMKAILEGKIFVKRMGINRVEIVTTLLNHHQFDHEGRTSFSSWHTCCYRQIIRLSTLTINPEKAKLIARWGRKTTGLVIDDWWFSDWRCSPGDCYLCDILINNQQSSITHHQTKDSRVAWTRETWFLYFERQSTDKNGSQYSMRTYGGMFIIWYGIENEIFCLSYVGLVLWVS
jgi:hypothetical protein